MIPLKSLGIGRHPSLPQRLSATVGFEPGLNADESHHFVPLVTVVLISDAQNEAVLSAGAATATCLPEDLDRSGLAGEAVELAVGRVEEGDEAKNEAGESEKEGEGDDQDGGSESGRGLAGVEELGGRRHRFDGSERERP